MTQFDTQSFDEITTAVTNNVLHIHFNRPHKKNAMNLALVNDVVTCFDMLESSGIRAVVIEGSDGNFCAGGDISDMHLSSLSEQERDHTIWQFNRSFGHMITKVKHAPTVVVAVVEGAVLGGGFGLACVADITLASDTAFFALPETGLGVIPAQIAPFVAMRLGVDQAKRLALTGEKLNAQQALQLGLVHQVSSTTTLGATLDDLLSKIKRCAPKANAITKKLLLEVNDQPLEPLLDQAASQFVQSLSSSEGVEGTQAFMHKRAPSWYE
ncbi:enoyl-CoA hydratase/isomerase family protein [Alteromonas sp. 009811495]|uniref:enoyl-CoA hydratase/isomerase family protein n=1 Tax=Alteromonas sp. 009811495 TaxID=3002962 RepID=UPI00237E4518|nr:enoyl-CoA hydratase-related protein [Alteromonas sp. 009811495]WDT86249.1 enoyl-CoA hydratase-related protein [Alteromonas sp. 009811495]